VEADLRDKKSLVGRIRETVELQRVSSLHARFSKEFDKMVSASFVLTVTIYNNHLICFQCFDMLDGCREEHPLCKNSEQRGAGMVICLERGAMICI